VNAGASPRILLRPLQDDDLPGIEAWFGQAVGRTELLVIVGTHDGAALGCVEYHTDEPAAGWLTIARIAVEPGKRGFGYGGEAVRLVESAADAQRFLAKVDPKSGLSLYFWLRMGYRPARPGEVFWRRWDEGGTIAMIRDAG